MSINSFQAVLNEPDEIGGLTYVTIPFNAWQVFQRKGRIRVKGKINNYIFRTNLVPKGNGIYILVLDKKLRKEACLNYGDNLFVEIELDDVSNSVSLEKVKGFKTSNIDVITAITTRNSIRKFTNEDVDENSINTILNSGFCAPSAKNKRPWHFIVIRNKKVLIDISSIDSNHSAIGEASCCIIMCGDKAMQGMNDFLIEDCSASMQNMLLTINGLGLGGVWCGIHTGGKAYRSIVDLMELPPKVIPIGIIAIGYPAEKKVNYDRFDKTKIHYEKW